MISDRILLKQIVCHRLVGVKLVPNGITRIVLPLQFCKSMAFAEACVKFFVAGANFTIALGGLALVVVGVLYKLDFNDYTKAIPTAYDNISLAPTLTIVIGSVIFVIAFFGCCGAIRESPCLLTTYAVILLVIFLLQIALGVFAFLEIKDKDELEDKVKGSLTTLFNNYQNNNETRELVDLIQKEFKCCGLEDKNYWGNSIPDSCKKSDSSYFEDGCIENFFDFLHNSIKVIGITVLVLTSLEIVGCVFSLCLSSSIKNRERRFRY